MRKPDFITFTGVDDKTNIETMLYLSDLYPIEWGILFSPSRQGLDQRYPTAETVERVTSASLTFAAHLCGDHTKEIMAGNTPRWPSDLSRFSRAQINHRSPDPIRIEGFGKLKGLRCIAQARGTEFPAADQVDWLFDASGGNGKRPDFWPTHPGRTGIGYAGGINPDNVLETIKAIDAKGPYWIDMESGVRTDNWFDLDLCRRVCETVYN